jgi:hypothetical protein
MNRIQKFNEISLANCYIAGGAILSRVTKQPVNDYDIYPKSKEAIEDIVYRLVEDNSCFVVNVSDRAITFKSNDIKSDKGERAIIQVMTFDTFETPEKIFNKFDFTVCMGAYDYDTKEFIFHDDFFPDVASKTLRFNWNTSFPLASMLRVQKYVNRGYVIPKSEMTKIGLAVVNKGMPTSWQELENAIGGTYGREVSMNTQDQAFSFEAAMNVLSNDMNVGANMMDNSSKFSGMSIERIIDIATNREVSYVKLDIENSYFRGVSQSNYFRIENGEITDALDEEFIKSHQNQKPFEGEILNGYKVVLEKDGVLHPGVRGEKSEVKYEDGKTTSWNQSPYLYLFSNIQDAKNRIGSLSSPMNNSYQIYKCSFYITDIKNIDHYCREIQVSKLKLEEKVV